jgi:hypothetical protein
MLEESWQANLMRQRMTSEQPFDKDDPRWKLGVCDFACQPGEVDSECDYHNGRELPGQCPHCKAAIEEADKWKTLYEVSTGSMAAQLHQAKKDLEQAEDLLTAAVADFNNERARIVTWLRETQLPTRDMLERWRDSDCSYSMFVGLADAIERGEHNE